jgi:hypothetical protein
VVCRWVCEGRAIPKSFGGRFVTHDREPITSPMIGSLPSVVSQPHASTANLHLLPAILTWETVERMFDSSKLFSWDDRKQEQEGAITGRTQIQPF